jgi:hypothetical protein
MDDLIDSFHSISGFRDYLDTGKLAQNTPEAFQDDGLCIGNQHTNR